MSYKILNLIYNYTDEAKKILDQVAVVDYKNLSREQLLLIIKDYNIIVCDLSHRFDFELLRAALKLKIIATTTTGMDHIDLESAKNMGIQVISLRDEKVFLDTITGTAELALGLLISSVRKINFAFNDVLSGQWDRSRFCGHNVKGMTLGIIGLGRLGTMMAKYCEALGMSIIFTDPNVKNSVGNWKKVDLETIFRDSDVITLHVHLDIQTENIINEKTLRLVKNNVVIINTSRGKIVNEMDMVTFLKNKPFAFYATDVLDGETMFKNKDCSDNLLVKYARTNNNTLIVPHIGGMTVESRRDTDIFIANKIKDLIIKVFK
jgi:D-3-phosphoglycerate dehydrogenase